MDTMEFLNNIRIVENNLFEEICKTIELHREDGEWLEAIAYGKDRDFEENVLSLLQNIRLKASFRTIALKTYHEYLEKNNNA